jgi:thiol-disulfide isomerase/thioredoxin
MKNLARFVMVISLLVVCNSPTQSSPSSAAPSDLDDRWLNGAAGYARAVELQRELNVPLVVYFYADWCPYCHTLNGQYLPSAPVQDYLRRVVKVRINPEFGRPERELAIRYGVTGYPTFLVMRTASAPPMNIQPFRKSGANLTPAQFANACRQAAPVSRKAATESNTNRSPKEPTALTARAGNRATRENERAQVVHVAPAAAAAPEFIKDAALPTLDQVLAKYVEAPGRESCADASHERWWKTGVVCDRAEQVVVGDED